MYDKLSILWTHEHGIASRERRDGAKKVITDLQIDRAFRTICPEALYREAFLSVLTEPLTDIEEIRKRTDVLSAFMDYPQLLDRLIELVRRMITLKNGWDSERSRLFANRRVKQQDKNAVLWAARETLILTSHFIRSASMITADIAESLNMFGFNNSDSMLGSVREAAFLVSGSRQAIEIGKFAERLEKGLDSAHTYDIEFQIDEELRCSQYFLRDIKYIAAPEKKSKTVRPAIFAIFDRDKDKKQSDGSGEHRPDEEKARAAVEGVTTDWIFDTAARGVQECDRVLTGYLRAVIAKFAALEPELYFYKAALMYMKRFEERRVRLIFPEFRDSKENLIDIKNLSDILLLTESMSVSSVVPNDVSFGSTDSGRAGILVTGKNNSGKTVYLRSIGGAVLLSQCGLPIPCDHAVISIRSRIFTAFAAAEGELVPQSSAGRFEEEVIAVSGIIDAIEPDSLLLMNETFQTTAYDEGADGMYNILNYISELGCGFIFVTHLLKLCELYGGESGVTILKTSDSPDTKYKIAKAADL